MRDEINKPRDGEAKQELCVRWARAIGSDWGAEGLEFVAPVSRGTIGDCISPIAKAGLDLFVVVDHTDEQTLTGVYPRDRNPPELVRTVQLQVPADKAQKADIWPGDDWLHDVVISDPETSKAHMFPKANSWGDTPHEMREVVNQLRRIYRNLPKERDAGHGELWSTYETNAGEWCIAIYQDPGAEETKTVTLYSIGFDEYDQTDTSTLWDMVSENYKKWVRAAMAVQYRFSGQEACWEYSLDGVAWDQVSLSNYPRA